jgi:hypothetical protein
MREKGLVKVVGTMHAKMWICTGVNVKQKAETTAK